MIPERHFSCGGQLEVKGGERKLNPSGKLIEDYPELLFLERQVRWRKPFAVMQVRGREPKGVFCDFQKGRFFIFNPDSWQVEGSFCFDKPDPLSSELIMGLIVIGERKEVEEVLERLFPSLSPGAAVFVLERRGEGEEGDLEERKSFLCTLGLVERSILTRPSPLRNDSVNQFLVWRARVPVRRGRRREED